MDSTHRTSAGDEGPSLGVGGDLRRLKSDTSASLAELREFLAQARGRSPQEVLGMVTGSHLTRCVVWATLGAAVILVAGTLVPYWMGGPPAGVGGATKAGPVSRPAPAAPSPGPQAGTDRVASPAAGPSAAPPRPSPADAQKAVKAMGLGETKTADPTTNPMDKTLDHLLDKLE